MKKYLPYFCKKIGISLVGMAIVLSFVANINVFCDGFIQAYSGENYSQYNDSKVSENTIISVELEKQLTVISLAFSFAGFLLYMFSREKIEDEFIQKLRYVSLAKSLLFTWIIASISFLIGGAVKIEGFYILQLQLIIYVVIYNYYKKMKFV